MIIDITQTTNVGRVYRVGSKPLNVTEVTRFSKSGSEYKTISFACDVHNMGTHIDVMGIDALGLGIGKNHGVIDTYLGKNKIYAIENLGNLESVPEENFKVYCLPVKIEGIDALPTRILVEI